MNKKRVAVLFGGESPEHEVSIITGIQTIENLDRKLFDVFPVYISKEGNWYTGASLTKIETFQKLNCISQSNVQNTVAFGTENNGIISLNKNIFKKSVSVHTIDVLFPTFHGGYGENGGMAGVFEMMHLPYVGPGITGGVLGMDKIVMKHVLASAELPIAKWDWFFRNEFETNKSGVLEKIEKNLQYPLFVKPANGGSSIGTSKVVDNKELVNAIEVACVFDSKIVVEESVEQAREINISVLGNAGSSLELSLCEEVFSENKLLSFEDKYMGSETKSGIKSQGMASTKRKIPANVPKEILKQIQETAKKTFHVLNASGVSRIDFLYQPKTNRIYVIEINTIPGSLSFYLWEPSGLSFKKLLTRLIDLAYERFQDNKKNTTTFSNNILENFATNKGSKGKF